MSDLRLRITEAKKIGLVGPLGVGKDFCAAQLGGTILGFADPLYALGDFLLDCRGYCKDKTNPGVRSLLQQLGQYGRGTVDVRYPLTLERSITSSMVRALVAHKSCSELSEFGVDWESFGRDPDIWVKALLRRAEKIDGSVVVTNLRFANEVSALRDAGFLVLGVVCRRDTLSERQKGRATGSDTKDISEELGLRVFSAFFDASQPQEVSGYIWNDEGPVPSLGKEGVVL